MNDFETHPRGTVEALRNENERLRELHRANARLLGFLVNEMQGRMDQSKQSALRACHERAHRGAD